MSHPWHFHEQHHQHQGKPLNAIEMLYIHHQTSISAVTLSPKLSFDILAFMD